MDEAVLVQETNNTVIWCAPHAIIAKVGTHAGSSERLVREHAIASALAERGAPVASPLPGFTPVRDAETGFVITLWCRLDHDKSGRVSEPAVGASLRGLHDALTVCGVELPSFRLDLERARCALSDKVRVAALARADRALLQGAFDDLLVALDDRVLTKRALHGEPHDGNRLITPVGLRWIDFESACQGPLEWDLAFLSERARSAFADVDDANTTSNVCGGGGLGTRRPESAGLSDQQNPALCVPSSSFSTRPALSSVAAPRAQKQ